MYARYYTPNEVACSLANQSLVALKARTIHGLDFKKLKTVNIDGASM